jgi:diacylglycerol kinase (ATP)
VTQSSYLFIINPNSGTYIGKNPEEISREIQSFAKKSDVYAQVLFTKESGHASELVSENLDKTNWKAVVAVGGDGTVNEIARILVHGPTPLGILPLGSGNGLARHLRLPLNLPDALKHLFAGTVTTIDSAELNGLPFFCTAGLGFDAYVGDLFSKQSKRGLATYISVSLKSYMDYKPQKYRVNGEETEVFSLSFANAGQYGNNAWVAPQADLQDGYLDICTIRPFPLWYGSDLVYRMFNKTLKPSDYVSYERVSETVVESDTPPLIHYDGEPLQLQTNRIRVTIRPGSLKVIT